jgi:hypothetical protein
MENKQYYVFKIFVGGNGRNNIEEQLGTIQELLDVHFEVYTCQIERNDEGKFNLRVCGRSKGKVLNGTILKYLRKTLTGLTVDVQPCAGRNAYVKECSEMNESKHKCGKSWKNGEVRVVEANKKHAMLWSQMQKSAKNEINWVQYVSRMDPNNKFLNYAEENDLFVHIVFSSIPQLRADVYNAGAHSVYVVDLRYTKKETGEQLYDALDEIRRGLVRKPNGKHRSQARSQIWCFADEADCDEQKYDVFNVTGEFQLVQPKRKREEDSKQEPQHKRIKLN